MGWTICICVCETTHAFSVVTSGVEFQLPDPAAKTFGLRLSHHQFQNGHITSAVCFLSFVFVACLQIEIRQTHLVGRGQHTSGVKALFREMCTKSRDLQQKKKSVDASNQMVKGRLKYRREKKNIKKNKRMREKRDGKMGRHTEQHTCWNLFYELAGAVMLINICRICIWTVFHLMCCSRVIWL